MINIQEKYTFKACPTFGHLLLVQNLNEKKAEYFKFCKICGHKVPSSKQKFLNHLKTYHILEFVDD